MIAILFRHFHICIHVSIPLQLKVKDTEESMAADTEQVRHRPGLFKQQNKTHKTGRHRSKGQLQKEARGIVQIVYIFVTII